ncbi:MAG: ABC transporter permease [Hoeflea sp.]|uniref:ABC transporter permease n=1 Tax=Hoeflea sp. TaxID=1940281 RepID=UPI001D78700C|nr:ABC transporter permease [Hoeflea sp.]MBU4529007.1 ABC transporter permease [Alphaproteobacteria bacterium]MBU4543412.1 ABC transporter permease [Alphaproteobacteria bacterium]MBU4549037.1 ABC transporter permease [Alphaproteobacteria bacterium]MBV1725172.1 ABC transporter permease [Hoeflea sp.]MBV1785133.1 ABC transporter permease [Hoeflea sp.]
MSLSRLLERLLQLIPVLLGVSAIAFLMMALTPGDPVQIMIGDQSITPEQEAELRRGLGLDRPLLERFFIFLGNALQFDFGTSFYHRRPVSDVIAERLPATIELSLVALIVALVTAIPLGVLAAIRKNSILDRLATVGSLLGVSLPGFWFGILLIMLFAVHLQILPVSGRIGYSSEVSTITGFLLFDTLLHGDLPAFGDALRHILLPAITLGLPMTAILMRVTRTSMLEVLRQDYVTFADAKGLPRRRVLFRHALKNALIPTVSVAAIETGSLLGGNMIVEAVFGWPGLGRLVVESIFLRNYPLVQAAVLLYAVTYVLLNFIADILYTVLNPRVKL